MQTFCTAPVDYFCGRVVVVRRLACRLVSSILIARRIVYIIHNLSDCCSCVTFVCYGLRILFNQLCPFRLHAVSNCGRSRYQIGRKHAAYMWLILFDLSAALSARLSVS